MLLVAAYWHTNLTLRRLAPFSGVSKSTADRVIDHSGPRLALAPRRRFAKDAVLIVDGTLVPTREKILCDCRLRGDGVRHAMHGVARLHNLALTG